MKTFNKTFLPDSIDHKGNSYKRNIPISFAMNSNDTSTAIIAATLKKEGRKGVLVNVLATQLKGKTDLHGQPYKPTKWIFTT